MVDINLAKVNAMLVKTAQQRDSYANEVVQLAGMIAEMQEKIDAFTAQQSAMLAMPNQE